MSGFNGNGSDGEVSGALTNEVSELLSNGGCTVILDTDL